MKDLELKSVWSKDGIKVECYCTNVVQCPRCSPHSIKLENLCARIRVLELTIEDIINELTLKMSNPTGLRAKIK